MARWMSGMALGALTAVALAMPAFAADSAPKLRHGYVDDRFGQLHYSIAQPAGGSTKTPIVLLHQSPNSSVEYDALVVELGKDRTAIAFDTPGHGGSDGPMTQPKLEDYAAAIAEGLKNMGYGDSKPVDIFGNHTGSRTATEVAVNNPKMIRHVILGLSPYALVDDSLSMKLLAEVPHPKSGKAMLERVCKSLDTRAETEDKTGLKDPIWVNIAVDSMRHNVRQEFGHAAAFEYGPRFKQRLLGLTQPVLMLAIDDPRDNYQGGTTAIGMCQKLKPQLTKSPRVDILANDFHNDAFYARAKDVADGFRKFVDAK